MRPDRHPHAEERRGDFASEQRPVPLVVGVRDERHARRDQLGTRRVDFDPGGVASAPASGCRDEPDPVIRAGLFAIFQLRLRHRRAEIHVPQRRRLELVREPAPQQAQERPLRDALRRAARWSRRSSTSPPTVPGTARACSNAFSSSAVSRAQSSMKFGREIGDRVLAGLVRRREGGIVRAATGRSGRRSSSAPAARSAGRCRPIPSDRTPPCPASAGTAR